MAHRQSPSNHMYSGHRVRVHVLGWHTPVLPYYSYMHAQHVSAMDSCTCEFWQWYEYSPQVWRLVAGDPPQKQPALRIIFAPRGLEFVMGVHIFEIMCVKLQVVHKMSQRLRLSWGHRCTVTMSFPISNRWNRDSNHDEHIMYMRQCSQLLVPSGSHKMPW